MKQYFPTGRRNHGRPLKRLLDKWDRNGSTSGPIPWKIDDDNNDNNNNNNNKCYYYSYYNPCFEKEFSIAKKIEFFVEKKKPKIVSAEKESSKNSFESVR